MNEDTLNMEIRKFLKRVGVTSQREFEQAVHEAIGGGKLKGNEKITVSMTLDVAELGLSHKIDGTIALE